MTRVRPIRFLGDSLDCIREFSKAAQHDIGYQLQKIQRGDWPDDFKPMGSIGKGVEELRVTDETGAYRLIYIARFAEAVYVLHAFQKKTRSTPKSELEVAKRRLRESFRGVR